MFYDIKRVYEPVPGSFVTRYWPLRIRGLHFWDITGDGLDDMILSYGYSITCIGGSYLFVANPTKTKYLGPARVDDVNYNDRRSLEIPSDYALEQNYPNPFNPTTKISFSLSTSENVTLEIFDILGQMVDRLLDNKYIPSGKYTVSWNASFHKSGVYFYRLTAGNKKYVKRMILMK